MHLTLGAGSTLCGTSCAENPSGTRAYLIASGCQRCARMLQQLQARCFSSSVYLRVSTLSVV